MQNRIEKLRQEAIKNCWREHKDFVRTESADTCKNKAGLEDYLIDCNWNEWEDIAFYAGYLSALRAIERKN
jgi:hypothetical protein